MNVLAGFLLSVGAVASVFFWSTGPGGINKASLWLSVFAISFSVLTALKAGAGMPFP